ncbi:hypothetical protein J5N97_020448 [Dioscorea zingiberensis]|uniref:Uncharacterized protein n=1 Tax=Dioscorea zingiberensis TaxID=325984 RepID=A0A9D5CGF6_9LILI|nr:hypothetical protein J5N97_020448 [Dioscorea zingiberensis]
MDNRDTRRMGVGGRSLVTAAAAPTTLPKTIFSFRKQFRLSETLTLAQTITQAPTMIYDVNSPLFRSFLSQKGGAASDKRKSEEQKPKEQKPKASENKPIMTE